MFLKITLIQQQGFEVQERTWEMARVVAPGVIGEEKPTGYAHGLEGEHEEDQGLLLGLGSEQWVSEEGFNGGRQRTGQGRIPLSCSWWSYTM